MCVTCAAVMIVRDTCQGQNIYRGQNIYYVQNKFVCVRVTCAAVMIVRDTCQGQNTFKGQNIYKGAYAVLSLWTELSM